MRIIKRINSDVVELQLIDTKFDEWGGADLAYKVVVDNVVSNGVKRFVGPDAETIYIDTGGDRIIIYHDDFVGTTITSSSTSMNHIVNLIAEAFRCEISAPST